MVYWVITLKLSLFLCSQYNTTGNSNRHNWLQVIDKTTGAVRRIYLLECLTRDRKVMSSNPAPGSPLCPWARHFSGIVPVDSAENEYLATVGESNLRQTCVLFRGSSNTLIRSHHINRDSIRHYEPPLARKMILLVHYKHNSWTTWLT